MSSLPRNSEIKIGMKVLVELKQDQGTGKLTEGIIVSKLTPGVFHPYGIMVQLEDGKRGRVKQISDGTFTNQESSSDDIEKEIDDISKERQETAPLYDVKREPSTQILPKSFLEGRFEDKYNEFKETFHIDTKEKKFREEGNIAAADGRKKESKKIEHDIKKEISIAVSAFGNANGGKLFIGVDDDGKVIGLDDDLKSYDNNFDRLMREIQTSIDEFTKDPVFLDEIIFSIGENNSFLVLDVPRFDYHPVYVHEGDETEFYLRGFGRSKKLSTSIAVSYIHRNFNEDSYS